MRSVRVALAAAALVVTAACTTHTPVAAPTLSSKPSASASPSATASATTSPTARSTGPKEHCSTVDRFCITLPAGVELHMFDDKASTRSGKVPSHLYDGGNLTMWVYTPHERNPRDALNASRDWSFKFTPDKFKGDEAIRYTMKGNNLAADDPFRNVVLKVYHGGKLYCLLIVAPRGAASVKPILESLTFL